MYHEERIIDGVLCWRGTPNGKFRPYTIEQLSNRLVATKGREQAVMASLGECIAVMKRNIYPKPDFPDDHPYAVLKRASAVYYGDEHNEGES